MSDIQTLVSALWSLFVDEIASGEPVVFCFSQETIKERLTEEALGGSEPLPVICDEARKCFDLDGNYVSLRPNVLSAGSSGFSMAIILVCQQILAVEEMVREGRKHSENAYFPRLRALMAKELPPLSVNPYRFEEFEAIWRTYAREIRSIRGSTDDSITFEFGAYTGVNKARLFPLSQALFSRADLIELCRHCRPERLRKESVGDVWVEIRRERNHLTRRGQRLVNSGFLRERLVEQVQKFSRRVAVTQLAGGTQTPRREQFELGISLDIVDWSQEEYRALLVVKDTLRLVDDAPQVSQILREMMVGLGYVVCTLSESRDFWVCRDAQSESVGGETILVVGDTVGMDRARARFMEWSPPIPVVEGRICPLGLDSHVLVCPVTLPENLSRPVAVRAGRIMDNSDSATLAPEYVWIGGLCVDSRSQRFLKEDLPSGIRFADQEYSLEQVVRVGDLAITWERLERTIAELKWNANYDLRFPNGRCANLSVGVAKSSAVDRMGFLIERKGLLSPTLERIGESDVALVGFTMCGSDTTAAVSVRTLANLIRDLMGRGTRRLTEEEGREALRQVNASACPGSLKRLIEEMLDRGAAVGEATYSELTSD